MLTFDRGNLRFNYRSVGVILRDNQVLIHKLKSDRFWALPGGRVEFNEPASETIKREMQEELGIDICVERLLWVVENFYEGNGKSTQEIALYFLIAASSDQAFFAETKSFEGIEEGKALIFQWHEIDALEDIELYPKFLQTSLKSLPQFPEYIVHYG